MTKEEIIKAYGMIPLDVEGGMWKAMFRSDETLPEGLLQGREGERALYGSILYLLTKDSVSRMHRLPTDEIWHFYMGAPCELLVLCPDGTGYTEKLGHDIAGGETVTAMVPRGCWQGVRVISDDENDFALLGTTMAPGYEDSDYEDGTEVLLEQYPDFRELILPLLARPE
jgi:predicted cupin superfamily sugar epimerase